MSRCSHGVPSDVCELPHEVSRTAETEPPPAMTPEQLLRQYETNDEASDYPVGLAAWLPKPDGEPSAIALAIRDALVLGEGRLRFTNGEIVCERLFGPPIDDVPEQIYQDEEDFFTMDHEETWWPATATGLARMLFITDPDVLTFAEEVADGRPTMDTYRLVYERDELGLRTKWTERAQAVMFRLRSGAQ